MAFSMLIIGARDQSLQFLVNINSRLISMQHNFLDEEWMIAMSLFITYQITKRTMKHLFKIFS